MLPSFERAPAFVESCGSPEDPFLSAGSQGLCAMKQAGSLLLPGVLPSCRGQVGTNLCCFKWISQVMGVVDHFSPRALQQALQLS